MGKRYESDRTRKEKLELEREKLSSMTFRKKLGYIWDYYKIAIFGFLVLIFCVYLAYTIYENSKYYDLVSISVVNGYDVTELEPVQDSIRNLCGTGDKYERVTIDTSYAFGDSVGNDDYNLFIKFQAQIAAKNMDILLCTREVYDYYRKDGYFLDLSTLFSDEQCAKYGISARDTAIDVSKLPRYRDLKLTGYEPCYLTVISNSEHTKNSAKFIQYLEEDL